MDYTEVVMALLTTLITILAPVLVTAAVVYGRKAVTALETSKYAEAYSNLDPVLRDAIEVAAADAARLVADTGRSFGRADVRQSIVDAAYEATNALSIATGVRVDLQRKHMYELIDLAVYNVQATLDELDADNEPEPADDDSGFAFYLQDVDEIDERFDAYASDDGVGWAKIPAGAHIIVTPPDDIDERFDAYASDDVPVFDDGTHYEPGTPRQVYSKYSEVD